MRFEARHLCVARRRRQVLSDVSIALEQGECVAVVGPNGAGKSTLMLTLLGLLPRIAGRVLIDDEPLERFSRRQLARRIAYVPQIYEGFLGFRIRDVVSAARYSHVDPLSGMGEADRQAVESAIERCGLGELIDRTVDTLSGGERQKVWVAAAVAQDADALFLDEPTSSLDPRHQSALIALLRDLRADGRTLLVICHDLNIPAMLEARVVALADGRVAFDGPASELLGGPMLEEVFQTRFVVLRDETDHPYVQLRAPTVSCNASP